MLCLCGQELTYPHRPFCPYPQATVCSDEAAAAWYAARKMYELDVAAAEYAIHRACQGQHPLVQEAMRQGLNFYPWTRHYTAAEKKALHDAVAAGLIEFDPRDPSWLRVTENVIRGRLPQGPQATVLAYRGDILVRDWSVTGITAARWRARDWASAGAEHRAAIQQRFGGDPEPLETYTFSMVAGRVEQVYDLDRKSPKFYAALAALDLRPYLTPRVRSEVRMRWHNAEVPVATDDDTIWEKAAPCTQRNDSKITILLSVNYWQPWLQ